MDTGEAVQNGSFATARSHLTRDHWTLLGILGATSFFEGYDKGVLIVALNQIRDSFSLSQADASLWLAVIFAGALPAIIITRKADVLGRRRVLLFTIVLYTIASVTSALAPSVGYFVLAQFVARLFLTAEQAIVITFAAEQLPAKARGFGFGFLGMMLSLGWGFGGLVYAVIEPLGVSWRWLYVASVPPLVLVTWLRRKLPESRKFEERQASGKLAGSWRTLLQRPHRRWLILTVAVGLLIEMPTEALAFSLDFLQEDKGFSASSASLAMIITGLPGIPIMVWAGGASDRYGRRLVGSSFMLVMAVGSALFFWLPVDGPLLLVFMTMAQVGNMGGWPIIGGMASELFPTSLRSQATSFSTSARVLGQALSLALGGVLLHATADNFGLTVTILGGGVLVAVGLVWTMFPDTHGVELEELSAEDDSDFAASTMADTFPGELAGDLLEHSGEITRS